MSLKLHLGAGYKRFEGYLNVDLDALCEPDVVLDIEREAWPWADSSVLAVKAHHILEHLGDPGFFHFMKELYRVCEDSAEIDIVVPHHRHDCFLNDPTHRRPITTEGLKLFSKKHNLDCIDRGDGSSRLGLYYNVDFELVDFKFNIDPLYQPLLAQIRPGSKDEQQFGVLMRERNNVVVDVHMTLMVVK